MYSLLLDLIDETQFNFRLFITPSSYLGASSGEGLGNAFLSNIQQVDGIFHVMRAFDDPDVIHVEERVDPVADIEIISNELRLKVRCPLRN